MNFFERIKNAITDAVSYAVWWIEDGDLVPLLMIVSVSHYTAVLHNHDDPLTATAIGALVDLGHYRSVNIATRYGGENKKERRIRYTVAALLTAIALYYHWQFYNDWLLAIPIPILIMFLAYVRQKDGKRKWERPDRNQSEPEAKPKRTERPTSETESKPSEPEAKVIRYKCSLCDFVAKSQNGLNGHMSKHSEKSNHETNH